MRPPTGVDNSIDNPTCNAQLDQSTSTVYDCVQKLVSALDARAPSFLHSDQLNAALNDAMAVMTFVPWSPIGYLHAGNIYTFRGQHYSAIRVYEQALRHVSRMDPRYQQLITARATSYDIANKRIDFVSELPLEVVTSNLIPRIFGLQTLITIGEEEGYLDICSTWRKRIAMTGGFEFLIASPHLTARQYHQIQDVAHYIKSLAVFQLQDDIISTLAESIQFHALKQLHINQHIPEHFNSLPLALHLLCTSLTQLKIDYGSRSTRKSPYSLCDLLDACPCLVTLSISHGDFDTPLTSATYPKLKKLELINNWDTVDVESLLRPFPQLQVLRLPPTTKAAVFPIIDQACPQLQQLTTWNSPSRGFPDTTQDSRGLCVLSVYHAANFFDAKNDALVHYMMKHCGTLEIIELECYDTILPPITGRHLPTPPGVTFEQLREIRYPFHICEGYLPWIMWMIRHAPRLESVETVHGSTQSPVIYDLLLPYHQHFKRIGMLADDTTQEAEKQFIQYHVAKGPESNLREISLCFVDHLIQDSWTLVIAQLARLTHLEILPYCDKVMVVRSFIPAIAAGCPALEQFTLISNHCYYNDIIGMSAHTNLKTLCIVARWLEGDAKLLVRSFQNLQVLHLRLNLFEEEDIDILDNGSFRLVYEQIFDLLL